MDAGEPPGHVGIVDEDARAEEPEPVRDRPADVAEADEPHRAVAEALAAAPVKMQLLVDAVRGPAQGLAVFLQPAHVAEQEGDRELGHVGGHRRRGVGDGEPGEERPGELALHFPAAVRDDAKARGERRQVRVQAGAVPGRHEPIGLGEQRTEACVHASRSAALPANGPGQPTTTGRIEEGLEERPTGEHEHAGPRARHQITFTSPWPDSRVLRTRTTTKRAARSGMKLDATRMGVNEKRSATIPIR